MSVQRLNWVPGRRGKRPLASPAAPLMIYIGDYKKVFGGTREEWVFLKEIPADVVVAPEGDTGPITIGSLATADYQVITYSKKRDIRMGEVRAGKKREVRSANFKRLRMGSIEIHIFGGLFSPELNIDILSEARLLDAGWRIAEDKSCLWHRDHPSERIQIIREGNLSTPLLPTPPPLTPPKHPRLHASCLPISSSRVLLADQLASCLPISSALRFPMIVSTRLRLSSRSPPAPGPNNWSNLHGNFSKFMVQPSKKYLRPQLCVCDWDYR